MQVLQVLLVGAELRALFRHARKLRLELGHALLGGRLWVWTTPAYSVSRPVPG